MTVMNKILCLLLLAIVCCQSAFSQTVRDNRLKPKWVSESLKPTNSSYKFYVSYVEVNGGIEIARAQSKAELCRIVQREENITVVEEFDTQSNEYNDNGSSVENINKVYNLKVTSDGKIVDLNYIKLDEYWDEYYNNGIKTLRFYTLYAVARPGVEPRFDDVYFTNRYGIKGMARSLVPGWGQLYKGQKVKGACIMGGEVLLIGSVIVSENLRSSYIKKMKEQPKFFQTYNSKADNWANIRNVCIGAAAALYVYNLIDAAVSPGARYAVVKKAKLPVMQPVACGDFSGISLAWYF